MTKIKTPKEFFGFTPGDDYKMIRWEKLCEYYYYLSENSDMLKVEEVGKTSEGNPFIIMYLSSGENIEKLSLYRTLCRKTADGEDHPEGKAVVFQSYGLHSNEVGGPQCVPLLVYDLITKDDAETRKIRDNVIFIISPCSEPDGEIIFTDWYYKYLGTKFEGICSPYLRHNYAGHSNNRDAFREGVIESKYLNDILIRNWRPQIFQDHHHDWPNAERISIAPSCDPIFTDIHPLCRRGISTIGATVANDMTRKGYKGVVSGNKSYNDFSLTTFYNCSRLHNVMGMLTESADVNIASPYFVDKNNLRGLREPSASCPDMWEGGWWHLRDTVALMYEASYSVLLYAANNKENILSDMAKMAREQIKKGEGKFFVIPRNQHDKSTAELLCTVLQNHSVKIYRAAEDGRNFKKGDIIVPLASPEYAFIKAALEKIPYPTGSFNTDVNGYVHVSDTANWCIAATMGARCYLCEEEILSGSLLPYKEEKYDSLSAKNNSSYRNANDIMRKGEVLYRDENGNFTKNPTTHKTGIFKVGLLKKSATWNEEEGYTRNLLRRYNFDFRIILDKEIREHGVPRGIEVLIIPGDKSEELALGDTAPCDKPPEYHSGLGKVGGNRLRDFVSRGGRVIAWEKSLEYINKTFSLNIKDDGKDDGNKFENVMGHSYYAGEKVITNGSLLRGNVSGKDFTDGMPKSFEFTHLNGPVLNLENVTLPYKIIAKADKSPLINGVCRNVELLENTPIAVDISVEAGDIYYLSFNPEFRIQSDGTFKLLFNALYK